MMKKAGHQSKLGALPFVFLPYKLSKSTNIKFYSHNLIKYLTLLQNFYIIFAISKLSNNPRWSEGGNTVSQVKVKENESLDSALRRFKRQTSRDGIIQEVRKREHYEKPSVARKKKSEAARKRKYK